MIETVHLSPSILNSWDELRNPGEDPLPWVNPEEFKKSVLGEYTPSLKAEAGNAVHGFVFENNKTHSKIVTVLEKSKEDKRITLLRSKIWNFNVSDRFLEFRKMFPYGYGIPEVSKVKYIPKEIAGCKVRISERADYLSRNLVTEMKTSSKPFSKKGTIRGYLESQQSFSYTWTWDVPIRFLFAEIEIDDDSNPMAILLKKASYSTAYPSEDSTDRLYGCVESLIPYLREDPEMWKRVTTRTLQDEF